MQHHIDLTGSRSARRACIGGNDGGVQPFTKAADDKERKNATREQRGITYQIAGARPNA
jgi:hypothetical protein